MGVRETIEQALLQMRRDGESKEMGALYVIQALSAAGYVIVPREPTWAMCERYVTAWQDEWENRDPGSAKHLIWEAWPQEAKDAQWRCIRAMLIAGGGES